MTQGVQSAKVRDGEERAELFKKMCRMLSVVRRDFLERDWRHYAKIIPQQQFAHLMMVRFALPCNMAKIMRLTGLTSAGASLFVEKMVRAGLFIRRDDPHDRRSVIVDFTPSAAAESSELDDRVNRYIYGFFAHCSEEELAGLECSCRLICRELETAEKSPEKDAAAKNTKAGFRMDRKKDGIRNFEPAARSTNGRKNANPGLSRDTERQFETFGSRGEKEK